VLFEASPVDSHFGNLGVVIGDCCLMLLQVANHFAPLFSVGFFFTVCIIDVIITFMLIPFLILTYSLYN
jgi:hypothetical protein